MLGRGVHWGGVLVESVVVVGIDLKVIAWDGRSDREVARNWLAVPAGVDPAEVEHYVMERFGDPDDVAVTSHDEFGDLVVGWVFPGDTLGEFDLPDEDLELMVVPFVRFPDGGRCELATYNAVLHREFSELVGLLDPDHAPLDEHPATETRGRLDQEHLRLVSADREQLELQLGGWFRRLLADGDTYLVIEVTGTGRYVQFVTRDDTWLRGEVVGNRYLAGLAMLDPDQHQRLVDIGWNPPGDRGDESGNYWVEWGDEEFDDPVGARPEPLCERDVAEAARFAAAALCDVFFLSSPVAAEVSAGPASLDQD